MSHTDIVVGGKNVRPHKTFMDPNFEGETILVDDQFDYVELWLKRHSSRDPLLFWQQARNFYDASKVLPRESRPLTAYYCMLNASKALLSAKSVPFVSQHGLAGQSLDGKTSLANQIIETKGAGVFVALASHFGANLANKRESLKTVLYNIPFIHRAFTVTYRGSINLFIPIDDGHFVRQNRGHEAWFCATIRGSQYWKRSVLAKQRGWELDESELPTFVIRSKRRFRWQVRGVAKRKRLAALTTYHQRIRRDIKYIYGSSRLWYYKRNDRNVGTLAWPMPALVFMGMHRLSELTRYDPSRLSRHFDCQHNWLLGEFISLANDNFIDQIASEITGREFLCPGCRR